VKEEKRECAGHFANFTLRIIQNIFSIVWSVKHSRLLPDEKHIEQKENKEKFFFLSVKGIFFVWHMWILTTTLCSPLGTCRVIFLLSISIAN
jgi:hypothetical protein